MNAQGEDVVAGTRTPLPISKLAEDNPRIYKQLDTIRKKLEKHYRDMMDVEFTIQQGTLYMLQCRVGKRTAFAAIRIAVEMVGEKLITDKEALDAHRAGSAEPAAPPDLRPEGEGRRREERTPARQGPERRTGRSNRTDRVQRTGCRRVEVARRAGHPHPHRDLPRGHQGYERRRRYSHRPRWHDLACGARCPPDGQGLRRRLLHAGYRLHHAYDGGEGEDAQGRRLDLDRRQHRRSDRRQAPDQAVGSAPGPHRQDPGSEGCPGVSVCTRRSCRGRTSIAA